MSQIHKRFTDEQVRGLFQGYCQGQLARADLQDLSGIGKSRFFALLKAYRHDPEGFTIAYRRSAQAKLSPEAEDAIKAALLREKAIGAEKRMQLVAQDLVTHFERRLEAMDGKAMVVGMSRRICVELYKAIARVNRVFKDKPGGLVVDYLGLANELRVAMAVYTESGGQGQTAIDQTEAVAVRLEKYEIYLGIFHGFDWSAWTAGDPQARLSILPAAQEHVLAQEDGKNRLLKAVTERSKAFALAVPHEDAQAIRDDVGFFQAVRSVLAKSLTEDRRSPDELDYAIRQIASRAVASDEVVDIFAAAGLQKPDISILSDEFLAEVRGLPQKNLAVETLRKLLEGEIKTRGQRNVVQARSFAEMLENAIRRYRNRAIEAAAVIEELIELAREMREANLRGEDLGLTEDEIAFYDALEVNDSALQVLCDETLRAIAQELVRAVRNNVTIDWTLRENVRAKMRVMVKRILRRYGYPPDKQEKATLTVLEQAEVLCRDWAVAWGIGPGQT